MCRRVPSYRHCRSSAYAKWTPRQEGKRGALPLPAHSPTRLRPPPLPRCSTRRRTSSSRRAPRRSSWQPSASARPSCRACARSRRFVGAGPGREGGRGCEGRRQGRWVGVRPAQQPQAGAPPPCPPAHSIRLAAALSGQPSCIRSFIVRQLTFLSFIFLLILFLWSQVNLEYLLVDSRTFITAEDNALRTFFGASVDSSGSYRMEIEVGCGGAGRKAGVGALPCGRPALPSSGGAAVPRGAAWRDRCGVVPASRSRCVACRLLLLPCR